MRRLPGRRGGRIRHPVASRILIARLLIGAVLPSGCQHRPGGPAADHRGSAGCVGFIAKRSHVGGKRAATNRCKLAQDLVGGVTHGLAFIDNSGRSTFPPQRSAGKDADRNGVIGGPGVIHCHVDEGEEARAHRGLPRRLLGRRYGLVWSSHSVTMDDAKAGCAADTSTIRPEAKREVLKLSVMFPPPYTGTSDREAAQCP